MSRSLLLAGPTTFFVLPLALPAVLIVLTLAGPAGAHLRHVHAGMNPQTHRQVDAAMQIALETHLSGRSRQWSSANPLYSGRITPVRTWRSRSGHFCRAFVEVVRLPTGVERNSRARACRNKAGNWVRI